MSEEDDRNDEQEIIRSQITHGGGSFALDREESDAISPTSLNHYVDELRTDGELLQRYNYFVYQFERDGFSFQARAYVDFIEEVSLLAPLDRPVTNLSDEEEAFRRDVLQYLKRRFNRIQELGQDGYVTIWERSAR